MDIKKMKENADNEAREREELETAKKALLVKVNSWLELGKISSDKWYAKIAEKTKEIIAEFKEYFEEESFILSQSDATCIEAKYSDDLKFKLTDINYDGYYMYLSNYNEIGLQFKIGASLDEPDYMKDKRNFSLIGIYERDYITTDFHVDYDALVNAISSMKQIKEANEIVEENKCYCEEGLQAVDTITLYIIKFGSEKLYNSFREFITDADDDCDNNV